MITQWNFFASWMRAKFGDTERGANLIEYALLVALIATVCIAAVTLLGGNTKKPFSGAGNSLGASG